MSKYSLVSIPYQRPVKKPTADTHQICWLSKYCIQLFILSRYRVLKSEFEKTYKQNANECRAVNKNLARMLKQSLIDHSSWQLQTVVLCCTKLSPKSSIKNYNEKYNTSWAENNSNSGAQDKNVGRNFNSVGTSYIQYVTYFNYFIKNSSHLEIAKSKTCCKITQDLNALSTLN